MVGIVVVSHSIDVAKGVCDMAAAMAGPDVAIIPAGGDADGRMGTDPMRIMTAIRQADRGDGVVILVDLGSGVLSANAAISMMGEAGKQVCIADAPLVEGAVSAAVEASMGSDAASVVRTAATSHNLHKL